MQIDSQDKVLSTNIAISIPKFAKSLDEAYQYLVGINGSPNSLNTSITFWKDRIGTPIGEKIKRFLNSEKICIPENQLTIIVSKDLISNPELAIKLVDYIFKEDLILINNKVNNYLPIKVEVDKSSYRFISQINEINFFRFKEPVKIRVNFKTNIQLDTIIPNISQEKLEEGVPTAPHADFFKALKKYLNEPENIYILEDHIKNIFSNSANLSPMITKVPKTLEDLKNILFNEYMYRMPIDPESLCEMALTFGFQEKSKGLKKIYDKYFPTHTCFGNEFENGASIFNISFPSSFETIESVYNHLQMLIEQLDNAQNYLKEVVDTSNSNNKSFIKDDTGIHLTISSPKREFVSRYYFNYFNLQASNKGSNDPFKNFQDMKEGVSILLANCKALAWFLGNEVIAQQQSKNQRIRRPEICDFVFSRIVLDPMLFVDCGNPSYEKISKMVMNL